MEKVLLIEIFQPFAQYRNPFTFYYAQTYPLPPKTTIIGMLQNATNRFYDEVFWNLKVSVHGGFESVFWNYQNLIKATKTGIYLVKHKGRLALFNQKLPLYGAGITSQRSPVYQQELFNGHLYIFLKGEGQLLNDIKDSLSNPQKILYLGRSEDVIFIKKIYELEKGEPEPPKGFIRVRYPTYIKLKIKKEGESMKFPINKDKFPVYFIETCVKFKNNGGEPIRNKAEITKETKREADFEPVIYAGAGSVIVLKDPEKDKDAVPIKISTFKILKNSKRMIFKIPEEFGWL